MSRFDRTAMLRTFRQMVHEQRPIIGGGAGTGLSAKCEEAGGIDLIIIYNSGRYRMAGRGSLAGLLAYGNANDIVMDMAKEVLPVVHHTPVLAGVNGTDPFCCFDLFLDDIGRLGFSGVQNFPTVGLIDGIFRQNLEETGMGYALEVEMIRLAHEKGLFTAPYVFDEQSWSRYFSRPYGTNHRRNHWCRNHNDIDRLRNAHQYNRRSRCKHPLGYHRPVPWRAHCNTRRRAVYIAVV